MSGSPDQLHDLVNKSSAKQAKSDQILDNQQYTIEPRHVISNNVAFWEV